MKRLLTLVFVCVLLVGVLVLPASAESAASAVDLYVTVNAEGDALVTMQVMLRLETNYSSLYFPLPETAQNITLNGSKVTATKSASATLVNISRITEGYLGEATMRFEFTIPEAVQVNKDSVLEMLKKGQDVKDRLLLTLPLLSGFELPVETLKFTITMPAGKMTHAPSFTSVYRQGSIESDLTILPVTGSQIIGVSKTVMNDREGITMTMIVPEEMFPTVSTYVRNGNPELLPIAVFAVLALVYWLLALRTLPIKRMETNTYIEGVTAGEMGCRLTLAGGDLTMMVFTWAQLGYLLISVDDNGQVLLHKRMDMGNERGPFENKIFRQLFGSRRVVDATGTVYAKLCLKTAKQVPQASNVFRNNSGNIKLFRALGCVCQIFAGICVAMNLSSRLWLATIMAVILGVFGAITGWLIQDIAYRTHLRGKIPVLIGSVCILLWTVLGLLSGQVWIPLGVSLGNWAFGFFAAYGGRRSDLGRHHAGQVLGLRHHLKHLPKGSINRLLLNDPEYFFNYAPYALAMGVMGPFARSFGGRKFDQCPYLVTRVTGKRTAEEWGQLLQDTADIMDAKSRRMQIEKWVPLDVKIHIGKH